MPATREHDRLVRVLEHGVALAVGMSAVFLLLVVATTPFLAAGVVLPASMALGAVRARLLPHPEPHCAVAPAFTPVVTVSAPKAATLAHSGGGASSAA